MGTTTKTGRKRKNSATNAIELRGCRVHNLDEIDVSIPRGKLVVVCGLSGSGKTSLALDTLYAEGQRAYIESFSAYTRQYLARLEKPDCDSIDGIPPAIAVTRASAVKNNRSTVSTATEIAEHVRLLFAKVSTLACHSCGEPVRIDSPESVAKELIPDSAVFDRAMVGFEVWLPNRKAASEILLGLQQEGFVRIVLKGKTFALSDEDRQPIAKRIGSRGANVFVVVDRLSKNSETERLTESLETAMSEGNSHAVVLLQTDETAEYSSMLRTLPTEAVDGRTMHRRVISDRRRCDTCDIDYPDPTPRLFNSNQPLGACSVCEGFGDVMTVDMNRVVPDLSLSIRQGAIAPWNTPSYRHELEELLALADDYDIPVDVPFSKLGKRALKKIHEGVPERNFGGLDGFFAWLDRKKYKMHIRVFAARYRSYQTCSGCEGKRLNTEALSYKIAGRDYANVLSMRCDELQSLLDSLQTRIEIQEDHHVASVHEAGVIYQSSDTAMPDLRAASEPIRQINNRLSYLQSVGLGYLQLNRTLRTLSAGETQRIALTSALGSTLVGMLYVLDEPTAGLHPDDVDRLIEAMVTLRDRGNTVIAVEHNERLIRRADHVIEIGPGAGVEGGQVVFEGTPAKLKIRVDSLTGSYLRGDRGQGLEQRRRREPTGMLKIAGARGNNLQNIHVEFPLGTLCVVTGRSGSGKSTLIHDTLFGAVSQRIFNRRGESPPAGLMKPLPFDEVIGDESLQDCLLVDQSPISRSPRSCPVTFAKAFDELRKAFAGTVDARIRNYKPGHFSFNSAAGQCAACEGAGVQTIDMQFLADVTMRCPECRGKRYREEVLQVRYRDRSIADVLEMSIRDAYEFCRGMPKAQSRLKRLIDVGLDYVTLGQPATTLSSGEAQRLKLASFLAGSSRKRTLFLMDEPTTGLHFEDVMKLIECFDALVADGHSLIVIEHHPMLIAAADWNIEIGPGAGDEGGQVIHSGPVDD